MTVYEFTSSRALFIQGLPENRLSTLESFVGSGDSVPLSRALSSTFASNSLVFETPSRTVSLGRFRGRMTDVHDRPERTGLTQGTQAQVQTLFQQETNIGIISRISVPIDIL